MTNIVVLKFVGKFYPFLKVSFIEYMIKTYETKKKKFSKTLTYTIKLLQEF